MEVRSNALVVIVYAVMSVTVVLLFYVGYRLYFRPSIDAQLASIAAQATPQATRLAPRGDETTYARPHRRQSFDEALRRIGQLKQLLAEKTALLNEKSGLLDKKTAENEKLSREANETFALMEVMTTRDSLGENDIAEATQDDGSAATQTEMARLEEELQQTDMADETLEAALVAAEWELEQAYAELAEAQQSSSGAAVQSPVESVATDLLVEIGASAVPTLAAALTDDRAEVRKWAANVLGEIGGAAITAGDALTMALRDNDPAVRQAADEALARIESDF